MDKMNRTDLIDLLVGNHDSEEVLKGLNDFIFNNKDVLPKDNLELLRASAEMLQNQLIMLQSQLVVLQQLRQVEFELLKNTKLRIMIVLEEMKSLELKETYGRLREKKEFEK